MDLRPEAGDISLCVNQFCLSKCKRYVDNWKPNQYWQSYISPTMVYDSNGMLKPCDCRMEWN